MVHVILLSILNVPFLFYSSQIQLEENTRNYFHSCGKMSNAIKLGTVLAPL